MSDKTASIIQKAAQERKRAQFDRALKRLEGGIAAHPEEIDLYLEAIDTAIEGGELIQATNLLKTVQHKFAKERERVQQFVREKLRTVHDPSLARCAVEDAVKRRDLEGALELLGDVPDHTIRELLNRARTKAQSLKSAAAAGPGVRSENVVNELTNAILSLRLGNLKDAMATFADVVQDKPVEHKSIDTFLSALAGKHPKAGRIRHARGCAMRAGGSEVEAIQLFVEAARLEPACAVSCIEQLQAMLTGSHHPTKVQRALAEVQLVKGDFDDAAQTLRDYLQEQKDNAREVIMLLRPFIQSVSDLNACTWLALELAMSLEQSSVALELLRPLAAKGHGAELYQWLEQHPVPLPPPDLAIFHASLAIEAKEYEHAADMLDDVCAAAPQEIPGVLSLIERHCNADHAIDVLHMKYSPRKHAPAASKTTNDGDFQAFESNDFKLETSSGVVSAPESSSSQPKTKPRFNSSPFSASPGNGTPDDTPMIERTELSLDDDANQSTSSSFREIDITEEHVANVAQKLYEAGAAVFFHIDDAAAPAQNGDSAAPVTAEEAVPVAAEAPAAPVKETFDQRYARFAHGELSNSAVLELLQEAVEDGRTDELHELLYFEPETGEEHFARYYYQAEYHILANRPIQALEILARLDTPGLETAHKQRVWFKIAVAQRMTHNFAGANQTLERLVEAFPGREDYARLKRRNHEQFIETQSLAATTLEKTSSLD